MENEKDGNRLSTKAEPVSRVDEARSVEGEVLTKVRGPNFRLQYAKKAKQLVGRKAKKKVQNNI